MWHFFTYFIFSGLLIFTHSLESASDRRCKFYDLSKISKEQRKPHSSIIQFYSSSDNIGNYLPVLGIHQMLGIETDLWCMHDKQIDFDFINTHYSGAIIGGAGLLNAHFEPFWKKLRDECSIPMIMWGLGICLPYKHGDKAVGVDKKIVRDVAQKCDLINVRDILTAEYYQLENVDISPCPTVVYIQKFKSQMKPKDLVLYDSHSVSLGKDRTQKIIGKLQEHIPNLKVINNIQNKKFGLEDYFTEYYCKSSLVITTRLHGAIIAYGLGIPCIMIPGDYKIDSFFQTYGFGSLARTANACIASIINGAVPFGIPLNIEPVLAFGQRACQWVDQVAKKRK